MPAKYIFKIGIQTFCNNKLSSNLYCNMFVGGGNLIISLARCKIGNKSNIFEGCLEVPMAISVVQETLVVSDVDLAMDIVVELLVYDVSCSVMNFCHFHFHLSIFHDIILLLSLATLAVPPCIII